jgi:hypothetical protein
MTEKQKKELKVLQDRLVKHEAEFAVLRKKYNGKCSYVVGLRKKVLNLEYDYLFEDGITIEKIMSINWTTFQGKWQKIIVDWLYKNYPNVHQGGYVVQTKQLCVGVKFDQNKPFEEQLGVGERGIVDFIPFVRANGEGMQYINVFESSLSRYGTYSIELYPHPEDARLVLINGSRKSTIYEAEIMDVFRYAYDNHPYIKKGCEEGDEDCCCGCNW